MIELAVFVVILCTSCASGVSPSSIEFERGSKGILNCPTMVDNGFSADDTEAIYWSFTPKGSSDSSQFLVSLFHGFITYGSNNGQYDILNSSLVISNVTQSTEGTYSYRYISWYKAPDDGSVEVSEVVSCKARRPKVNGCNRDQQSCTIEVPSDDKYFHLTGSVEHAKPAVNISWFLWSSVSNKWEEINAARQFEPAYCKASETNCFFFSDTVNSFAAVLISLESIDSTFKCETNNKKLGSINVTVTVIKAGSDIETGVTNPTGSGSYELSSVKTTSEPPTSSGHPISWFDVGFYILSVLFIGILMKHLYNYRKRRLYLKGLPSNTNHQVISAQETMLHGHS